jgi:type IV secretion system protein VirB9
MTNGNKKAVKLSVKTAMTAAVLTALLFRLPAEAAISKPMPRPAAEKAGAENAEKRQEEENKKNRAAMLDRLRRQYPGLDIPEDSDILWADSAESDSDSRQENDGNENLFAEFRDDSDEADFYASEPTPQDLEDAQLAQLWMDVREDLDLREIDRKALALVREFAGAKHAVPPTPGQNGAVTYNFGDHIPKIVCRTNRITDISLEAGEQVMGVHMGDTVRWQIAPSKSGAGAAETVHVIVKPLVPDISTNLVVMTDRRTYNIDLVASATDFIPSVRFAYPADTMSSWEAFMKSNRAKAKDEITLPGSYGMSPDDLYFGYEVKKGASYEWAPLRIFDDGVKTYIEMPAKYKSMEAPVVMFFEGKEKKMVNYRVKDRFYIIDRIMSGKAALILGQKQVVIQRVSPRKK